jgi:hypothetical protein
MTNPNSLLLVLNLGLFSDNDSRPSMLEIQNFVNGIFFYGFDNFFYKRFENLKNNNWEVYLFFQYSKPNQNIESLINIIDEKISITEKQFNCKVSYKFLNRSESNEFLHLTDHDDMDIEISDNQLKKLLKFI